MDRLTFLVFVTLIVCLVVTFAAYGDEPPKPNLDRLYPIDIERIVDGDTVAGVIHLPWDCSRRAERIRLAGYDAWEKAGKGVTPEEKAKGVKAAMALRTFIDMGEDWQLERVPVTDHDTLRCPLGRLWVDPKGPEGLVDVAGWMRAKGHAKP